MLGQFRRALGQQASAALGVGGGVLRHEAHVVAAAQWPRPLSAPRPVDDLPGRPPRGRGRHGSAALVQGGRSGQA
ncbi:hypothetical protein [Streptomyces sp. NEAU-YJ-81]|uniref:hypothetical protein n=1 Tax=Streptomyces sp. NEAU-YJ-81 TaxID=2820288 RepID=UPI001ABC57B9|nr:hypothetical protein [Streptomyces sp. NEAU-YJ-81]MBO3681818.1 hypothetical protein [Streptomyces sp. NEAU-YJ-81]